MHVEYPRAKRSWPSSKAQGSASSFRTMLSQVVPDQTLGALSSPTARCWMWTRTTRRHSAEVHSMVTSPAALGAHRPTANIVTAPAFLQIRLLGGAFAPAGDHLTGSWHVLLVPLTWRSSLSLSGKRAMMSEATKRPFHENAADLSSFICWPVMTP